MSISQLLGCWALAFAMVDGLKLAFVSDVHYDPRYGAPGAVGKCDKPSFSELGTLFCDSPLPLISSAIKDIAAQSPDAILFTGDWMRHDMAMLPTNEVLPTFRKVVQTLARDGGVSADTFAGALGNNDFVPDYFFNLSAPVHPLQQGEADALVNFSLLASGENSKTFGECGVYSMVPQGTSMMVLVLNTLIWDSYLHPPMPEDQRDDPCGQFSWIKTQLKQAKDRGIFVIIMSHIPTGQDTYGLMTGGDSDESYWSQVYLNKFVEIVADYKDIILAQFYGHTHTFSFIADDKVVTPTIILPSISRVYGSNPSYFVAMIDEQTTKLASLRQRFLMANGTWSDGLEVSDALGISLNSMQSIQNAVSEMMTNEEKWKTFSELHSGGVESLAVYPDSECDMSCRAITVCTMLHVSYSDVMDCVRDLHESTSSPRIVSASGGTRHMSAGVIVLILLGCIFGLFSLGILAWKYRSLRQAEEPALTPTLQQIE